MMFLPAQAIVPPMVSSFARGLPFEVPIATAPTSATWESAGRAVYQALVLPSPCVIRRVWWANGATTTGGATIEVGIYADSGYGPGAKLISGSATQGTASQVQIVDVTDTALPSGLYWLALMASSASSTTLFRVVTGAALDAAFRFQEASADPLPASATPVESTSTSMWLFGFATTASP